MDGVQLHRLGKRLIELSRDVTVRAGATSLTPGEVAVLQDVLKNPASTVSEIHVRTGFAQSHISASVAQLKERGLIETASDPADRRRTRVRLTGTARHAILRRASRPAGDAIARAVAGPSEAKRVALLLDQLASLLL